MSKQINMTKGPAGKQILLFALPLMLGNVFQQMYTVVDTAIVGKGVGMDALAALGSVDWLNWMYLGIVQGFAQGFSVLMAQKYGNNDISGLKNVIGNAARISIYIGCVTMLIGQLFMLLFFKLLQVPNTLTDMAELYSRIIMLGIPASMFFNFTASVLRSVGDSRTPLAAMAVSSVTNIVLDCVAVFLLDWGIAGAAVATVVSQSLPGFVCMIKILRTPALRFTRAQMGKNLSLTIRLMKLGTPVTLQNTVIAVGGMAVTSVVNRFETSFIAGFVATNKLYGVLEIAALSYGYAVTTFVGQNFGAMNWKRIEKGVAKAVLISLVTAVAIGTVMIVFGRSVTMLFISSDSPMEAAKAGETACRYLCYMASMLPVLYLLYVYRSSLQGMGNTLIPLVSGIVEFVIRVAASVAISCILWQEGLFLAEVSAWFGSAVILAISYYKSIKKIRRSHS